MTKISNQDVYANEEPISANDFVIGTNGDNPSYPTKTFTMGDIRSFTNAGLNPIVGGTLAITEYLYTGVLTTPQDVVNQLMPNKSITQYEVFIVSVNGTKYIANIQDVVVGDGQPPTNANNYFLLSTAPPPAVDQNNYVRQLLIDVEALPDPDSYTVNDLIDYILALPEAERTVADTDSKWNIIPTVFGEGNLFIEIYELQNIGKGVITALDFDNFLLITKKSQGLQDVMNQNPVLTEGNFIDILQSLSLIADSGPGTANGIVIKGLDSVSPGDPVLQEGVQMGQTNTERSLSYYADRTEFMDGLNLRGIQYKGDYEANFVARSLVTRKYVDDRTTGSETKVSAGANISVTGDGTTATPYVISGAAAPDLYLQKVLNYPADFTGSNYTFTNADKGYVIYVKNGANAVNLVVPAGLSANFEAGVIHKGTADITYVASGTTIENPVGLKSKGTGYNTFVIQEGSTNTYNLLGNTKA